MLTIRNLPAWERWLRGVLALAAITAGVMLWGKPGAILLLATGCMVVLTGLFGFCPVCAVAGRRRL